MSGQLNVKIAVLSALIDDAESIESIRDHGFVAPYGLALVPERVLMDAIGELLKEGLAEAWLPDAVGGATVPVPSPSLDEDDLRTYWFLPSQRGWRLLWDNHAAVMQYWVDNGPT